MTCRKASSQTKKEKRKTKNPDLLSVDHSVGPAVAMTVSMCEKEAEWKQYVKNVLWILKLLVCRGQSAGQSHQATKTGLSADTGDKWTNGRCSKRQPIKWRPWTHSLHVCQHLISKQHHQQLRHQPRCWYWWATKWLNYLRKNQIRTSVCQFKSNKPKN